MVALLVKERGNGRSRQPEIEIAADVVVGHVVAGDWRPEARLGLDRRADGDD